MEVKRQKLPALGTDLGDLSGEDFRIRQLRARDMLRGDLEGRELNQYVEERVLTTTMDKAVAWARSNALFPATFGLFALIEITIFIALLMAAFIYVWRRGALEWR